MFKELERIVLLLVFMVIGLSGNNFNTGQTNKLYNYISDGRNMYVTS